MIRLLTNAIWCCQGSQLAFFIHIFLSLVYSGAVKLPRLIFCMHGIPASNYFLELAFHWQLIIPLRPFIISNEWLTLIWNICTVSEYASEISHSGCDNCTNWFSLYTLFYVYYIEHVTLFFIFILQNLILIWFFKLLLSGPPLEANQGQA